MKILREASARRARGPLALVLLLCGLAAVAFAEPPASVAPSSPAQSRAEKSFRRFASSWMKRMERAEDRNRQGVKASQDSYRGVRDDFFRVQLRPTGSAKAPYVGVLQYQEQQIRCENPKARKGCKVVSTTPVTEIFRFQNGHWIY